MKRTLFTKLSVLLCLCLVLSLPFVSAETFSLTYDNNGNLVTGQYFDYTYNALNQLTAVHDKAGNLIEEYTYDGDGNRVRKIEHFSDGTSETTYYPFPELVRKVDAAGTEDTYYYFYDGDIIARDDPDGSRKYYHNDHLGSHTLVTDASGAVVEETTYKPFGGVWTGGEADFLYTGKERDFTNLYYYGARYYDPELHRFTQPDTVIQDKYNPQNLNRYSYVLNNPYKYVDPSGHFVLPLLYVAGVALTTLVAATSPYWATYLEAYSVQQATESASLAYQDPTVMNIGFAALSVYDAATPGIPEGTIAKNGVEVAGKAAKSVGIDIVGTRYNLVKPTQEAISPIRLQDKLNLIESGGKPLVRLSWFGNEGPYITGGHHSFVGYNLKGVPLKDMEVSVAKFTQADKTLFTADPRVKFQEDWSKVRYEHIKGLE